MRVQRITINPFVFTDILRCDIHKTVNDHATARISGHIPSEMEDRYINMSLNGIQASILIRDDSDKEQVIFHGIVRDITLNSTNSVKTLDVDLISSSYLMDNLERTRTFQNVEMSYESVLEQIGTPYSDYSVILTNGSGETIKNLIVQYRETDWAFAKRLASHFNSVLVPAYYVTGVKYFFGLPNRGNAVISRSNAYSMRKSMREYLNKTSNNVSGIGEHDAIYYQVDEREIYELAQNVSFMGQDLYVFEIQSEMKGGELIHHYVLKTKAGFITQKRHNAKITGASLAGHIIDIKQDTVKVHVSADKAQDKVTASWFSYSTAYSSPDGTGWYCMPEVGDAVRLYFPSEKEADGYVISATHLETSSGPDRSNPDNKSLKSKYGKEVLFTPNSLTFTNNAGMSIEILDDEGISIVSDKKITFVSDESIVMASLTSDLRVIAPEAIVLEQSGTQVTLQESVVMSGARVAVQKS